MEQMQEKEEDEEDFDFVPESEFLNEAKKAKLGDEESELIIEVLENLEKTLLPININVINFSNDKPKDLNYLFLNKSVIFANSHKCFLIYFYRYNLIDFVVLNS